MVYIGIINPDEEELTLKERRPDPIEGGMKEVLIGNYPVNGSPLEPGLRMRSLDINEDGLPVFEMEADDIGGFGEEANDEFWNRVEDELGITFQAGEVGLNENMSAADNYRGFLSFLYEEGHLTEDDLPVKRQNARSRYLVNSEPQHISGEMSRPEELDDGIYFETNLSSGDIKRNIRVLAELLVED